MNRALRWVKLLSVFALVIGEVAHREVPAIAAQGDLIAEVITPEGQGLTWARGISPSVAFDGQYLYHTSPDALGTAALVAATPYIDVDVAPNDIAAQCGYSQSSGVATGGANLFISVAGCPYYFEYTKTGVKVAAYAYNFSGLQSS